MVLDNGDICAIDALRQIPMTSCTIPMLPDRNLGCAGMQVAKSNEKAVVLNGWGSARYLALKFGACKDRKWEFGPIAIEKFDLLSGLPRLPTTPKQHLPLSYLSHNYSFLFPR